MLCHDNCMFELCGNRPVRCSQGPAIAFFDHTSHAGREKRLDGEDQPIIKDALIVWIMEVQDLFWFLVQFAPNPMTRQIIDDVISALSRFILDRSPDPV